MKAITAELIRIYQPDDIDWMGYYTLCKDDFSFHHIIKKCDGGPYHIDNGALLNRDTAHPYLHLIEVKDLDMFDYINKILKDINTQRYSPTKKQLLAIRSVLESFEREHCSDRTKRGKILLKAKYIEGRKKI